MIAMLNQKYAILFLCATAATATAFSMEEVSQQITTKNDLRITIEIGEKQLDSLAKLQRRSEEQLFHTFSIPKEGALLKVFDESCHPSSIDLEIEEGTQYISLSKIKDSSKFEIKNDTNKLLAELYIVCHSQG